MRFIIGHVRWATGINTPGTMNDKNCSCPVSLPLNYCYKDIRYQANTDVSVHTRTYTQAYTETSENDS